MKKQTNKQTNKNTGYFPYPNYTCTFKNHTIQADLLDKTDKKTGQI